METITFKILLTRSFGFQSKLMQLFKESELYFRQRWSVINYRVNRHAYLKFQSRSEASQNLIFARSKRKRVNVPEWRHECFSSPISADNAICYKSFVHLLLLLVAIKEGIARHRLRPHPRRT